MVRQMLAPNAGWSLVAQQHGNLVLADVVGFASVAPVSASEVEVGLLVEDRHQRQGLGARLLYDVAMEAAARGYQTIACIAQPDNHAVITTVHRAGLIGRVAWIDGLLHISVPVRRLSLRSSSLAG